VVEEVRKSIAAPLLEPGRGTLYGFNYPAAAREALARHFNAEEAENIQFTANVTDSLNVLIHGFARAQNGRFHAITTELEHNSVLRPLNTLARSGKIALTIVPFDERGYVAPESVARAVRKDTKLAVFTHGSNVLGTLQKIGKLCGVLSEKGVYSIVDAAQTAGNVKIDLSRLPVDAFAFTGHKYLYGITGIGGFYVKDPGRIETLRQGGTGSYSENPYQPERMPLKFEAGTQNHPGIASVYAGVGFIEKAGLQKIRKKTRSLARSIVSAIGKEENVTVYNRKPDLPIISFNIRELACDDVGDILGREYGVVSRAGLHCVPLLHKRIDGGRGCVRLSPSYFNTAWEAKAAGEAVVRIAESAGKMRRRL